jgi:hypothetical protein
MLYAVFDYWNYRHQRGKYSFHSMKEQGFSLAVAKNFESYRIIPLGHIVFVSTSCSIVSWVIMYAGNGVISHTSMFYGDGVLHDTITSGVQRRDFSAYLDGVSYISIIAPPPGTDLAYAKAFMDSTLGASYNWSGIARLGFLTIIGSSPGAPWHVCCDAWFVAALGVTLIWLVTGNISTASIACLIAYPVLFAFNKFRHRKWMKEARMRRRSNS